MNTSFKISILIFILTTFILLDCDNKYESTVVKNFTPEEKVLLTEQLINGLGSNFYQRGDVGDQMIIEEIKKYNKNDARVHQELGLPYLMNGMQAEFYPHWEKMVQADSVEWQGYRGYYYLYFLRDYERAIADFDDADNRTPNFVDYPNTQSIDYLRAICYERLNQPKQALAYIDKHIEREKETVGENYIYTVAFIVKGHAHEQLNELEAAKKIYEKGIEVHPKNADLKYYYGNLLLKLGEDEKAKEVLDDSYEQFLKQEFNTRFSTAEFYQIYEADFLEFD